MFATAPKQSIAAEDYRAFKAFLQDACGIVLGDSKEYLVASRLNRVMGEYQIATLGDLLAQLESGRHTQQLRTRIIDAMTTRCATPAHCTAIPRSSPPTSPPGLWRKHARVVYCGMAAARGLDQSWRQRFFVPKGDCPEIRPDVKRRVSFRELNLAKGYELLGRFDIIFCRNVLIYFSSALKRNILERMARVLNPGGYIFLGSTESLNGHTDTFEMVSDQGGIVYRVKTPSR